MRVRSVVLRAISASSRSYRSFRLTRCNLSERCDVQYRTKLAVGRMLLTRVVAARFLAFLRIPRPTVLEQRHRNFMFIYCAS